jgi:predicted RNase H-like nuclease (RuvC/YqgF family)
MNSAQESKNELEAAIRYAENAISSAKTTIESMEFRQEMAQKSYQEQTGREKALQNQVDKLKSEGALLDERIGEMKDSAFASRKTIEHLKDKVQGQYDDIKQLERDLTVKTANANAWKKEYDKLKGEVEFYTKKYNELAQQKDVPTMPVIPKDVAIAIFREGVQHGVEATCTELDEATYIRIEESEYVGDFHITFERDIDLNEHIDTDWMRSEVGRDDDAHVIEALKNLCADNEFECRIHGVDDEANDSASA